MDVSATIAGNRFVHLHVHSYYSFFDSTLPPEEIVQWAARMGAGAIAVTDTNCLTGAVVFHKAARAAGIKPILGAEITQPFAADRELLRSRDHLPGDRVPLPRNERETCPPASRDNESTSPCLCPGDPSRRCILLARNFAGYSEISHIVTRRMLEPDFDLLSEIRGLSGDVIAFSDCPEVMEAWRAANPRLTRHCLAGTASKMHWSESAAKRGVPCGSAACMAPPLEAPKSVTPILLAAAVPVPALPDRGMSHFRGLRVSPRGAGTVPGLPAPDRRNPKIHPSASETRFYGLLIPSPRRRRANRSVYECAQRLNLPLVVACDAKLGSPEDSPLHDLLQAMRRLTTIHQFPEEDRIDPARHLQSESAIRSFWGIPASAAHPAGSIRADIAEALENTTRIAAACNCDLPLGEWKFLRFQGLREPPSRMLRELVERGVRQRYGTPSPPEALERMNYELSVIEKLKFTEYFLLVNRIVEEAHSRGFFTVGRGSAANSIVSYALRFTDVCPIRYNLFFERFLNPERNSPPDIDIDFSWKERDELLQWCFDFFGHDRVALISTIQTLQTRQSIREVAKAHGISERETNAFTSLRETNFHVEEATPPSANGSIASEAPRTHNLADDEPWRTILQQAARIAGFPRHLSIHCGGIIIAPRNVIDFVPLTRSAKGFVITQMDMFSVEDMGLIKIDLLSNRSLGVLKDALNMIDSNTRLSEQSAASSADGNGSSQPDEDAPSPLSLPVVTMRTLPPGGDGLDDVHQVDPALRQAVFRREASRIKLAGTRRGTSVALAGILDMFASGEQEANRGQALPRSRLSGVPENTPRAAEPVPALPVAGLSRLPADCRHFSPPGFRDPCVSLIRKRAFDFEYITRDPATRELIDMGQTMGCFYIESPGMRALFERLRCQNFEEVVAASSIIRPGVAESGMMQEYIARHQQKRCDDTPQPSTDKEDDSQCETDTLAIPPSPPNKPSFKPDLRSPSTMLPASPASSRLASGAMPINAHAKSRPVAGRPPSRAGDAGDPTTSALRILARLLPETYGVMVYQEDVLKVANQLAGMSLGEADLLRRAMSGKLRSRDAMEEIQRQFMTGSLARGVCEADAKEIWRMMASFAGYSFCKGHSAAFAVLSYQVAFLKAHYPAEFFAAVLSNGGGFYGPGAYIQEAHRFGIQILLPCINESEIDYTGRTYPLPSHPPGIPLTDIPFLRIGLLAVRGLSAAARRKIVRERSRNGKYRSLPDFIERARIGLEECRALIKVGALDCLATSASSACSVVDSSSDFLKAALRPRMLIEAECIYRQQALQSTGTLPLAEQAIPYLPADMPRLSLRAICRYESESLGYMVSAHPLDFVCIPRGILPARDIRTKSGRRVRMVGWMISAKLLDTRTDGKPMKMLSMEDKTGTFEAVLFPRVYEKFAARTLTGGPYLLEGKVDMKLGSPTLNVENLSLLARNC